LLAFNPQVFFRFPEFGEAFEHIYFFSIELTIAPNMAAENSRQIWEKSTGFPCLLCEGGDLAFGSTSDWRHGILRDEQ